MAIIYAATLRTARMQAVLDAIAGGNLQIGTAGMGTVLGTIPLATPAGSVSGDTLTLTTPQEDTAADASGTAAAARIRDSGNNDEITGLTVGGVGSGANIEIQNTNVAAGQKLTMTAGSITHNTAG